jgi:bifunctional non-homologous end joining protein LigD
MRGADDRARAALRRELVRLGAPRALVVIEDIAPMQAEVRERPFSAPGWVFELKYDGYRVLAGRAASGVTRLLYRSGVEATALFPELAAAVAALPFAALVVDGEAVALDPEGRPSFGLLQRRAPGYAGGARAAARAAKAGEPAPPIALFLFDLLACEGFDLRPLPLATRKALLRQVLAAAADLRCASWRRWRNAAKTSSPPSSRWGWRVSSASAPHLPTAADARPTG